MKPKISHSEIKCLEVLVEYYSHDCNCLYFRAFPEKTGLTLIGVKRAVRSLAKKGLAEYVRGLFDEDGFVAGSGYRATYEGANYFKQRICQLKPKKERE